MAQEHHDKGTAFLPNLAEGVSPSFEPVVKSGGGVALGATNELALPIPYTLDAEMYAGYTSILVGDETSSANTIAGGFYLEVTVAGTELTRPIVYNSPTGTITAGNTYIIAFDATVTGTCVIESFDIGANIDPTPSWTIVNGMNYYEHTPSISGTDLKFYFDGTSTFTLSALVSLKQITNPNSFITLVNGDGTVEQIGNSVNGGSTDTMTNGDFSDGTIDGWTPSAGAVITNDAERLHIQFSDSASGADWKTLKLKAEHTYRVSIDYVETNYASPYDLRVYDGNVYHPVVDCPDYGTYYTEFVATITTNEGWIRLSSGSGGFGAYYTIWDNVIFEELLPASTTYTLTDQTVLEALPTTAPFTTADLALIEAEPSLMGRLALGATDTGLSLVTADVFGWYPMMEYSGAYVVDANAGYGVDLFLTENTVANWTGTSITETQEDTSIVKLVSTVASGAYAQLQVSSFAGMVDGTTYVYNYQLKIDGGTGAVQSRINSIDEPTTDIVGNEYVDYPIIFTYTTGLLTRITLAPVGIGCTVWAKDVSVREATASEITNYTETIRDISGGSLGTQKVQFVRDAIGVPESVTPADTINVYSDTKADTGVKLNLPAWSVVEKLTIAGVESERVLTYDENPPSTELLSDNGMDDPLAWDTPDGFVVADGVATSDAAAFLWQTSPTTLEVGKTYRVAFDMTRPISGFAYPYVGGIQDIEQSTSIEGFNTFDVVITTLSNQNIGIKTGSSATGLTIDDLYIEEVLPTTKYYIDKTLQGVNPALPDPTKTIDWGSDVAQIGYPDVVTQRHDRCEIYSVALTQAEIDAL